MRGWGARAWAGLLGALAGCSFAPSAGEIQAEFAAYVAAANQCTQDSECAVAVADCPLGCWVAVRRERKADVEAKARVLVDDNRRGGGGCYYDCAAPGVPTCTAGRCAVAPAKP